MIDETLKELNNISGVLATFLADINGHVIANTGEIKAIPLQSVANEIKAFLINSKLKGTQPLKRFQFTFDNIIIIIELMDFAFIAVLCKPDKVTALLRLTLDVLCSQIKKNKTLKNIATI